MNYFPGFDSTHPAIGPTCLIMPEDKLSDLRLRLEKLEALLQDAVLDEGDNLGSRLEMLTDMINDVEKSVRELDANLDSRIECVQAAEIERLDERLDVCVTELKELLAEQTESVQSEAEQNSRRLDDECAELRRDLENLQLSTKLQSADIDEINQNLSQEIDERTKQAEELEAELRELRRQLAAKDEQLQYFAERHQADDGRIASLWSEINRLRADLTQVAQAAASPSVADQFLGCMLGLAIMGGLGWLAFKTLVWLYGLIR
jgi:chromosome segregation ATPase